MKEITYSNAELCAYKRTEEIMEVSINAFLGLLLGIGVLSVGANVYVTGAALSYSILSLLYAVKVLPSAILMLIWAKERPVSEIVELRVVHPGCVEINGVQWDVTYSKVSGIVVDCYAGVVYAPNMKSLY